MKRVALTLFACVGLALLFTMNMGQPEAQTKAPASAQKKVSAKAVGIFAGGCFWCVEHAFDDVKGVISTTSGYIGGRTKSPTYKQVSRGGTGHAEAVRVVYDPKKVSYRRLLKVFWRNIDPLTANAQFCDHGSQYRAAIFYLNPQQKKLAVSSKARIANSGRFQSPIVTEIVMAGRFYDAETYHQDYHHKNPIRYNYYRYGCGRDRRLKELWGERPS